MRLRSRTSVTSAAILVVAVLVPLSVRWDSARQKPPARSRSIVPPPPRSTSARARREAIRWYGLSKQLVNARAEELEKWDPRMVESMSPEALRRTMTADTRELQMAIQNGERAAHLAVSREDRYEASLLLSRLYCDAGIHDRELTQARMLIALSPRSFTSLKSLRRAAGCNHLASLARKADFAIEALPVRSPTASPRFGPMMIPEAPPPSPAAAPSSSH
jgi:hypothetical protein